MSSKKSTMHSIKLVISVLLCSYSVPALTLLFQNDSCASISTVIMSQYSSQNKIQKLFPACLQQEIFITSGDPKTDYCNVTQYHALQYLQCTLIHKHQSIIMIINFLRSFIHIKAHLDTGIPVILKELLTIKPLICHSCLYQMHSTIWIDGKKITCSYTVQYHSLMHFNFFVCYKDTLFFYDSVTTDVM